MNHYTLAEMVPGLSEDFTVTVTAEGPDEDSAISAMEQLFKENL